MQGQGLFRGCSFRPISGRGCRLAPRVRGRGAGKGAVIGREWQVPGCGGRGIGGALAGGGETGGSGSEAAETAAAGDADTLAPAGESGGTDGGRRDKRKRKRLLRQEEKEMILIQRALFPVFYSACFLLDCSYACACILQRSSIVPSASNYCVPPAGTRLSTRDRDTSPVTLVYPHHLNDLIAEAPHLTSPHLASPLLRPSHHHDNAAPEPPPPQGHRNLQRYPQPIYLLPLQSPSPPPTRLSLTR